MRDGGEYLDLLSKALIRHKNFKNGGIQLGGEIRERGRISGDLVDYWEVVGGGRARVGFTQLGRHSAGAQGAILSSIAPAARALPNRGSHKRKSKKARPAWLGPQVFGVDPTREKLAQPGGPTGQCKPAYVCVERSSRSLEHAGLYAGQKFPQLPRWD
jgi:hypothetical protein